VGLGRGPAWGVFLGALAKKRGWQRWVSGLRYNHHHGTWAKIEELGAAFAQDEAILKLPLMTATKRIPGLLLRGNFLEDSPFIWGRLHGHGSFKSYAEHSFGSGIWQTDILP
jgi:hypothetical protein